MDRTVTITSMFEQIVGNELIKAYLKKAIGSNSLPQTLLFCGPDGIGKSLFAKAVAAELLASSRSPDLHLLAPEGKSGLYQIDSLREMIEKEHSAPFQGSGKVFILEDVERMQPASGNALLKTLEEPSGDTTFILLSSRIQEILPTILSRCVILRFQPLSDPDIETLLQKHGFDPHFAKLAQGSAGRAFELAQHPELEEQRKILFDLLRERPSYPELCLKLEQLEALAEEGKEEDPVRANRRVEYLFSSILMWHRDQEAKKLGWNSLFFKEEKGGELVSLPIVEKAIEKGRLAYGRNMKLSHCLGSILRPL